MSIIGDHLRDHIGLYDDDEPEPELFLTPSRRAQRIRAYIGHLNREVLELRKLGHRVTVGLKDEAGGSNATYLDDYGLYWSDVELHGVHGSFRPGDTSGHAYSDPPKRSPGGQPIHESGDQERAEVEYVPVPRDDESKY